MTLTEEQKMQIYVAALQTAMMGAIEILKSKDTPLNVIEDYKAEEFAKTTADRYMCLIENK